MKKRLVSLLVTMCVLLGLIVQVQPLAAMAEDNENSADVSVLFEKVSSWATGEVGLAYEKNLVPDCLIGKDLTQYVDREYFAAIAVKLYETVFGVSDVSIETPFVDIESSNIKELIGVAYNLGIVAGTSETTFEPYKAITREEMATMMCRVFKKYAIEGWKLEEDSKYKLNTVIPNWEDKKERYEDDGEISQFAKASIFFLDRYGIIKGIDSSKYAPLGIAKIEQALAISLRCYMKLFNETVAKEAIINADAIDYKKLYMDYVREHGNDTLSTSTGLMLVDVDSDGVPEMFNFTVSSSSVDYDHTLEGLFAIKGGKVMHDTPWKQRTSSSTITGQYSRFYRRPEEGATEDSFICVVKNKATSEYALAMRTVSDFGAVPKNMLVNIYYDGQTIGTKYERTEYNAQDFESKYDVVDTPMVSDVHVVRDNSRKARTKLETIEILCDRYAEACN